MAYLIYGAYGYTGSLIARRAVEQGHRPVLSGRSPQKLEDLASALDLPFRQVDLSASNRLRSILEDVSAVIHCAGPFSHTARPMVDACLDTGTHYLDITGEIDVFEAVKERGEEAREAGVMLLPGVGFDVVPTDCLARFLSEQLPSATALDIAFLGIGGVSKGTLKTAVEQMGKGGRVRRQGEVIDVPPGWTTRTVDFGDHPRTVISIPWGDVVTAGYSTGIPNVTVYTYFSQLGRELLRLSRHVQGFLAWSPVQAFLQQVIDHWVPNPSLNMRRKGSTVVWASVRGDDGRTMSARLDGPEAYVFTARTAVCAAGHVMEGAVSPGYQTPSTAFGADFVLEVGGVERERVQEG